MNHRWWTTTLAERLLRDCENRFWHCVLNISHCDRKTPQNTHKTATNHNVTLTRHAPKHSHNDKLNTPKMCFSLRKRQHSSDLFGRYSESGSLPKRVQHQQNTNVFPRFHGVSRMSRTLSKCCMSDSELGILPQMMPASACKASVIGPPRLKLSASCGRRDIVCTVDRWCCSAGTGSHCCTAMLAMSGMVQDAKQYCTWNGFSSSSVSLPNAPPIGKSRAQSNHHHKGLGSRWHTHPVTPEGLPEYLQASATRRLLKSPSVSLQALACPGGLVEFLMARRKTTSSHHDVSAPTSSRSCASLRATDTKPRT